MRRALSVLLLTLALAHLASASGEPYDIQAYLWVRLTVANNSTSPYPLKPLFLDLPLNDTYQRSRLINVTVKLNGAEARCNTRLADGECGTRYLEVQCPWPLPARGVLEVTAVSEVYVKRFKAPELSLEASGLVSDISPELKPYTRAEGPWRYDQTGMAYLAEAAREIAGGEANILAIVTRLVEWLWKKVEYETGPPRYPNETLPPALIGEGRGKGDCDDQANLLILMLRSLGIPSYLKLGLVTDFDYRDERVSWTPGSRFYWSFLGIDYGHGWAEVYVPPWGWLPVDLTYNLGKENPLNAIITSAVSDHWKWYSTVTVRVGSICHADYIGEWRAAYAESLLSPLFYYTQYAIVRKGDSIERVVGFFRPLPLPWVKRTTLTVEYPSKAKVFETVKVTGLLEPPPPNATLLIEIRSPSGRKTIETVKADSAGRWSFAVAPYEAGAWLFNVTFPGLPGYASCSREFTIYAEKLPSSIALEVAAGNRSLLVQARLNPPLDTALSLLLTLPNGTVRVFTLPAGGGYLYAELPAAEPGEYKLDVFWQGSEAYDSAHANSRIYVRAPTRLAVNSSLTDRALVVSGMLEPRIANATLTIVAESPSGALNAQTVTDAEGRFSLELRLSGGTWVVWVLYNGSELYLPSSAKLTVEVETQRAAELQQGLLFALCLLSALIAAVALRRIGSRRRPREPPTSEY